MIIQVKTKPARVAPGWVTATHHKTCGCVGGLRSASRELEPLGPCAGYGLSCSGDEESVILREFMLKNEASLSGQMCSTQYTR